jgi:60 kDa SS-A/Ro ribonucleoprotein
MTRYAKYFKHGSTPQSLPASPKQARNAAGGYAFVVSPWTRLERFLILGAEGGTYYASEQKLVLANARGVAACLDEDGLRAVAMIVAISEAGRAPKQSPAIFALAMACAHPHDVTRTAALAALPRVCRTGAQLFEFLTTVQELRGWGRSLRKAVCRWYMAKTPDALAYQVVKYRQRAGFSHRDALRLAGGAVGPRSLEQDAVLRYLTTGTNGFGARAVVRSGKTTHYDAIPIEALPRLVLAFEELQGETDEARAAQLITDHGLTHEMVPTTLHGSPLVWGALLEQMPMTAMLRNLGRLTTLGVLAQGSAGTRLVVSRLHDVTRLAKARVHPLSVLVALNTYRMGHGVRGGKQWKPVPQVVAALESAFDLTFGVIPATGARTLFALDVSGSMGGGQVAGMTGITPRVGSAAMAMATMRAEPNWMVMGFSHELVPAQPAPAHVARAGDPNRFGRPDGRNGLRAAHAVGRANPHQGGRLRGVHRQRDLVRQGAPAPSTGPVPPAAGHRGEVDRGRHDRDQVQHRSPRRPEHARRGGVRYRGAARDGGLHHGVRAPDAPRADGTESQPSVRGPFDPHCTVAQSGRATKGGLQQLDRRACAVRMRVVIVKHGLVVGSNPTGATTWSGPKRTGYH